MILHIDSIIKSEWKFYGLFADQLSPGMRIDQFFSDLLRKNGNVVIYDMIPRGEDLVILWAPIELVTVPTPG